MIDIYMITNLINGKRYVGKTQRGYLFRFEEHCNSTKYGFNTYIGNAINKYGRENFKVELLKQVEDDTWEYWEKFYISEYKTLWTQNGYNITDGGDSNPMDNPAVRLKHRIACNTPEMLKRLSEIGKNQVVSKETREKIRQNNLKNIERVTSGFRKYNESRKTPVAIIEGDEIIKEFQCASDACRYLNKPSTEAGNILYTCDKFNKNGKRSKIFGYCWTKL